MKCTVIYLAACNKTYGAGAGGWHSLAVPRPRGDALPFLCLLTLQGRPGHPLQLRLDKFRLGRLVSRGPHGCPDGGLSISEGGPGEAEPGVAAGTGQWCGSLQQDR